MADRRFRNMVNLGDVERHKLLYRLHGTATQESIAHCEKKAEGRADTRYRYARDTLPIAVEHPGGGVSTFMVCGRNLSNSGMAFIHGSYLNTNTQCRVLLEQIDGTRIAVDGAVVGCRHLQASLHEISIKFERRIEIEAFMNADERDSNVIAAHGSKEDSNQKSDESSTNNDSANSPLVNLQRVAAEFEQAIEQGSIDHIRSLCHEVSSIDPAPALSPIVTSARSILELIENAGVLEDMIADVRNLASMCAQLAPPQ